MATAKYYGGFFQSLANKEIDIDSDAIKLMLTTSGYTPNQDTHRYKSSVTNEVANGNGYTTGGALVAAVTVAYDPATNIFKIDGDNVLWLAASFTTRWGVLYDSTPASDAVRPLIGYVDFGADLTPVNAPLSITWNGAGIATVTVG